LAKLYLTDAFVKSAICSPDKYQEIFRDSPKGLDGKTRNGSVSGLGLRVTESGAKSFVHSFRFNGKHRRSVIGNSETMNVMSARFKVLERNKDIAQGVDPDQNVQIDYRKKYGETFGEVISSYFEQHLSTRTPSHQAEFSRLVAPWTRPELTNKKKGAKRTTRLTLGEMYREILVEDLTPQHIGPYLQGIKSDSIANSTLRQLKALFNWVIRMQIVDMRNPCSPFQVRKIIKERRDYTPDQVKLIAKHVFCPPVQEALNLEDFKGMEKQLAALKAARMAYKHDQLVELCAYMGILFLTMARPSEVKQSKFIHFDLDQLIWHKHNTKGIKLSRATYEFAYRSVPIHPKIAELIRQQRARWPDSEYVFPNHSDQLKPRDNFQKAIKGFKNLDGVPEHFQLYDLKRMAISMMMMGQGVRREDVSHYVDHKGNLETTLIYDLGFVDPMRPVAEKLGKVLGV